MHFYKRPRRIQYLFLGLIVCIFMCKMPTLFYVLYFIGLIILQESFVLIFCFVLFCFAYSYKMFIIYSFH